MKKILFLIMTSICLGFISCKKSPTEVGNEASQPDTLVNAQPEATDSNTIQATTETTKEIEQPDPVLDAFKQAMATNNARPLFKLKEFKRLKKDFAGEVAAYEGYREIGAEIGHSTDERYYGIGAEYDCYYYLMVYDTVDKRTYYYTILPVYDGGSDKKRKYSYDSTPVPEYIKSLMDNPSELNLHHIGPREY